MEKEPVSMTAKPTKESDDLIQQLYSNKRYTGSLPSRLTKHLQYVRRRLFLVWFFYAGLLSCTISGLVLLILKYNMWYLDFVIAFMASVLFVYAFRSYKSYKSTRHTINVQLRLAEFADSGMSSDYIESFHQKHNKDLAASPPINLLYPDTCYHSNFY